MKHDYNEMLSQIAEAIGKFLKKEGGMNNGYDTNIKGFISHNSGGNIVFNTPKTESFTGRELRYKSEILNEKLIEILKAYEYKGDIKISSTHMEHGCYEIEVSFKTSAIVNIPF